MSRPPTDATSRSGARYVVTLHTSSAAMPVTLAAGLAFPGLSVFRSRSVEDGRERFRLHLGYFASASEAEAVLAGIRSEYPTALVASVPVGDNGSLDDTINTAFSLVRGAVAQAVDTERASAVPAPARQDADGASPAHTLTPGQVASAMAPQRYAVQLDWSLRPIDPASVPRLGIFRAYNLYAVSVLRQGCAEYGLRLGFFKNLDGARQVADYVRHQFGQASVVPVSYREYARASELTRPGNGAVAGGSAEAPAAPPQAPPAPPAPTATGSAADQPRTGGEPLPLHGAHDLEVDRDRDGRVTLTAEERAMLTRRPTRGIRRW